MKHLKRNGRRVVALALASIVAGCAGGSTVPAGSSGDLGTASPANRRPAKASAKFEIRIPKRRHRAHYVSPNTNSMTISIDGTKQRTVSLTPSSPGCTTIEGGTQCTYKLGVPSGTHTYSVALFQSTDGSGTALSTGSVVKSIPAGTLAAIPLTLGGVVASLTVALGNVAPSAGTAATVPVWVDALDASGATIIGPGAYVNAAGSPLSVTLSNSDTSGITALSTTSVTGPGAKVSLAYNGGSISQATIGASASGVSTATATFAPVPTIFASFTIPASVGGGSAAYAIATGPDNAVWYTTQQCASSCHGTGTNSIVRLGTDGSQTPYVGGVVAHLAANGNFTGITAGPDGALWFTDNHNKTIGRITTGGVVTANISTGSLCPERIIKGPASDGGLWFTSSCTDSIGHITTGGILSVYTLSGGGTAYYGILLGKDGNLYVADTFNGAIGQVQIAAGAVTGYSEIAIPNNPTDSQSNRNLQGLAQTSDGQLWFTNQACNPSTLGSIVIKSPFSLSTPNQFVTKAGCSDPAYMATSPDGSMVFEALWDYPIIEVVVPTTPGAQPVLTDYAYSTVTPNTVFQETWDVAIGPNGNVYSTVYTSDRDGNPASPANVVEMAY